MRIRGIGAAVLVAAGLSLALTGVAAAGEPDDDATTVYCETPDGDRWTLPEEDVERLRALPAPPGRLEGGSVERFERAPHLGGPQGDVRVLPAQPAEPAERSDGVRVRPAEPGDPEPLMCTVEASPHD